MNLGGRSRNPWRRRKKEAQTRAHLRSLCTEASHLELETRESFYEQRSMAKLRSSFFSFFLVSLVPNTITNRQKRLLAEWMSRWDPITQIRIGQEGIGSFRHQDPVAPEKRVNRNLSAWTIFRFEFNVENEIFMESRSNIVIRREKCSYN